MKRQESFEELRKRKVKFSLRTRLTLSIGAGVRGSIVVALGLSSLLTYLIPQAATIPTIIQLNVFSLLVALIVARWLSRICGRECNGLPTAISAYSWKRVPPPPRSAR